MLDVASGCSIQGWAAPDVTPSTRTRGRCVYCGGACVGPVCAGHMDLLGVDQGAPKKLAGGGKGGKTPAPQGARGDGSDPSPAAPRDTTKEKP